MASGTALKDVGDSLWHFCQGKHQCFACLLRQQPQKHGGWKTPSASDEPKCGVQEKVNFSCHMGLKWPKHMCSKWPEWPKWRGWPKWPNFTCGQLQQNSWATLHGRNPNSWAVKVVTRQRWSPETEQDYLWRFCIFILHLYFVFVSYIYICTSKQRWSPEAEQDYFWRFCICILYLYFIFTFVLQNRDDLQRRSRPNFDTFAFARGACSYLGAGGAAVGVLE